MGSVTPIRGERTDTPITDLHLGNVQPQNSGLCMEQRHPGVSLHLGAGHCTWPAWINVDSQGTEVSADLMKLPFANEYADRVAAIHVLEHFYLWEAADMLREWKRVMKPGAQLILELPCMDKVLNYITRCIGEGVPLNMSFSWWALWGDPKHKSPAMCHRWGWTLDSVEKLLASVGFTNIQQETPRYHFKERDMRVTCHKGA